MFHIKCKQCATNHPDGSPSGQLVGSGSILSLHNTSEGPIAYVKCPDGHTVVVPYGREWLIEKRRDEAKSTAA
jgi:hypothetical protein